MNYTNWIYNPRDVWMKEYFIVTESDIYRNSKCALTEENYEALCDRYGVNPIYPTKEKEKYERLPMNVGMWEETLAEKISRKRKELGHPTK